MPANKNTRKARKAQAMHARRELAIQKAREALALALGIPDDPLEIPKVDPESTFMT